VGRDARTLSFRDRGGPEETNVWTPIVVAPVLTVYVAFALGLGGGRKVALAANRALPPPHEHDRRPPSHA
jgi:hypothetical protein